MEILGLKVRHEKLGVGMITHRAGNLFIVTFPARHGPKLREYIYPDAFAGTLEAVSIDVQEAILPPRITAYRASRCGCAVLLVGGRWFDAV